MGEHAVGEFAGHVIKACRAVVERRNEREDRSSGICGSVHVADVNLIERRLADAEHQRPSFFESYIGGALDELGSDAVGNAGTRSNTAGDDDHPTARVRTAGHIRTDIGIRLQLDLAGGFAQDLADQIAASTQREFFGEDAQGTVGSNEVDGLDAGIAFDGKQKLFEKDRSAGACRGYGQVVRFRCGQADSLGF